MGSGRETSADTPTRPASPGPSEAGRGDAPWTVEAAPHPFERVPLPENLEPEHEYPASFRSRIVVDTPHDGDVIPERVMRACEAGGLVSSGVLEQRFVRERDWGADLVAEHLARALGLDGWYRVRIARVVMDFNRFPGISPPRAGPMECLAISDPVAGVLGHEDRRYVIESCYDRISAGMEAAIFGSLIKISIHTYDEHNKSRTRRPEVSLLSRSESYQRSSHLPYGLFDPLFPDILVESSAKRILRDRIALTLEKAGVYVEHNYPYCLPDGSLEIRSQPWFFFQHLRKCFECERPETRERSEWRLVWNMLLNTNLRAADSEALRGYLHRLRRAPAGRESLFNRARMAYEALTAYLGAHPTLVDDYRLSSERTSAISIEVRKDLVWRMAGDRPLGPDDDRAREVAGHIARSIATYLREDRADAP